LILHPFGEVDMNILDRVINEPVQNLLERMMVFFPQLLLAVVVLLGGLLVGWLVKVVLGKILMLFKVDSYSERGGLSGMLAKSGLREPPSVLLSKVAGGVVVFFFFLIALSSLNIKVLDHLIERAFNYLPDLLVAGIIAILGYMLGNFFGRTALITAVNAGVQASRLVGHFVRYMIFILTALIALEHLGVGKESVLLTFTILFGGIVLALAIAFGLGGRDLAKDYLDKKFRGGKFHDDLNHL